ncbi:sarcosine oxidase subunit gamma [Salinarimonas ramus]|uniref:Sarcosine oxidase subunit gamma n=1 Tax=Salinarimonas ramus TaxID=690164 RepID=A0A917V612_9HYPH|nr:sarcosine oxidase subunit gamma family protein [Salinarimonas ramus]GGK42506.1 sarcosine oxidase subunit gamma [Salinarimonas ramus]
MLEIRNQATRTAPFPLATETVKGTAIAPLPPRARLSLRLRPAEAARIGSVAGLPLDRPIGTFAAHDERRALRLGPDEWLVSGPADETDELGARIAGDLAGIVHALVDVSHRNCGLAVSGAQAEAALNAGCPLDLSLAAFPVGAATRTLLGKAEILLVRVDAACFEVECWRSFAEYVRTFLVEAARGT